MEMKNFDEFKNKVAAMIKDYLPEKYKDATVEYKDVVKNNDTVYTGLLVRTGEGGICPTLYLENFFKAYTEGVKMDDILTRLAETYAAADGHYDEDEVISLVLNYGEAKKRIVPRLINRKMNEQRLKGMPHTPIDGDLAVSYHIHLGESEDGNASVQITNEMFAKYGITLETLHKDAMENLKTVTPVTFLPISTVICNMFGCSPEEVEETADFENEAMFVLSNEQKVFGAVWILDMEEMAKIREQIGEFYILPSSVHETILVKKSGNKEVKAPVTELNRMVAEVNATQVAEDEILADHIYEVDWEKGTIVTPENETECGCTLNEADAVTDADAPRNQGTPLTGKA